MTKDKKKLNSRWRRGAERYTRADSAALKNAREPAGWRNGARVSRR